MIITYIFPTYPADQIRVQQRCRNFADAINRTGAHQANLLALDAFAQNTPAAQKICAASDLLIIYRHLYGPVLAAIQYWQAREKKVILDFDQPINYLTPDMPDYHFWWQGLPRINGKKGLETRIDPVPLEQFKWGLGMVDAATAASARLADDWSQCTKVYELPDYLNTSQYPLMDHLHENETWIGLGCNTHYTSLKNSGLADALEQVCRENPQVRLVVCDPEKIPVWKLGLDPQQVILRTPHSFDEWVSVLLQLDLGLAPTHGDFDLRFGPVNLLEFMIAKIPWIATEQPTFRHLSPYGRWVQNSPQDWQAAIQETVARLAVYQKKAARESFLFALGQDVSANIDKVLKLYAAIINQTPG